MQFKFAWVKSQWGLQWFPCKKCKQQEVCMRNCRVVSFPSAGRWLKDQWDMLSKAVAIVCFIKWAKASFQTLKVLGARPDGSMELFKQIQGSLNSLWYQLFPRNSSFVAAVGKRLPISLKRYHICLRGLMHTPIIQRTYEVASLRNLRH